MTTGVLRFAAFDPYYSNNVSVVIADNPCIVNLTTTNSVYKFGIDNYDLIHNAFESSNVWVLCGPNWTNDKALLCTTISQTVGSCHFDNFCSNPLYPNAQPESVLTNLHDYQLTKSVAQVVRDFAPEFRDTGDSRNRISTEYDLGLITVPFLFYQGTDADMVCNLADAQTGAAKFN